METARRFVGPRLNRIMNEITEKLRAMAWVSALTVLSLTGCGQTEKPTVPPAQGQVYSYFGVPFVNRLTPSISKFDHSLGQVDVSSLINRSTTQIPTSVMNGDFAASSSGFLSVTENFAIVGSSFFVTAQNPPLTGAWAVEIQGVGVLANFLRVNDQAAALPVSAAPAAMAQTSACPNFAPTAAPFLYVTVPNPNNTADMADYGGVGIATAGSAVTFTTQPYLIGPLSQTPITVTGGCSQTVFGPVTAYPLNSFGTVSNLDLVAIGDSGLLVSSFVPNGASTSLGAFGGGAGVIGVATPSSPIDVASLATAKFNGFFYAPETTASTTYDVTVLGSSYGDYTATSPACSALRSSLAANSGQGADTVPVLPSANALYGGEFLVATSSGPLNDPTSPTAVENCDVAIDLGTQDPGNNGLFPNATLFLGSNFPPFSTSNPWNCQSTNQPCAVSFPAAAVVGTVQGHRVIFVVASAFTNPAAQLPNNLGSPIAQPLGIYLFEK